MKPNFALNLSHEGISLLHRATTGWLQVGDVSLDDPNLTAQLKLLRSTAADLENGGLTTKLVIPNSQILYTEIDAPGPDTAARIAQIRDGLVGMTPYDVSDLVFDWRSNGTTAKVAVVARDTLREAEGFATEYRFNPISFVAVPANGSFEGEPYFGPTRYAAKLLVDGEVIEPDGQQINILGPISESPGDRPKVNAKTAKPKPKPVPSDQTAPKDTAPENDPGSESGIDETAAETPKTNPETLSAKPDLAPPALAFATRRPPAAEVPTGGPRKIQGEPRINFDTAKTAPANKPKTDQPTAAAVTAATLEPEDAADARSIPAFDRPGQASDLNEPALYPSPKPAKPDASAKTPAAKPTKDMVDKSTRTPMQMTAPHTAEVTDPTIKSAERPRKAQKNGQMAKAALAGTLGKLGRSGSDAKPKPQVPKAAADATTEADSMTVFGARGQSRQRGKPKYLGMVLTLGLLAALAVLALWSTYFMNDVTSGLFGTVDDDLQTTAPAETVQPDPVTPAGAENTTEAAIPSQPEAPQSSIDAAVEAAMAEGTAPEPSSAEPAGQPPVDLALLQQPDPVTELDQVIEPAPAPEADTASEPTPESGITLAPQPEIATTPGPEGLPTPETTVAPDPIISVPDRQSPPTRAQAEARYAATGIWQLDPEPLNDVPGGGDQLEDIYVASVDPAISTTDATTLPPGKDLATDRRPPNLTPPAALGTRFDLDDRGLVRATPEGAVTPEGVRVFSGKPSVAPGARPADLKVPLDETRLIQDELPPEAGPPLGPDALSPDTSSPGTLSEGIETSRLGGVSNTGLAAIRPAIRPVSLVQPRAALVAPPAENTETAQTEPAVILDNATKLAVVASLTPPGRPAGFAAVVQRVQREAARAHPTPEPEAEEDEEPETVVTAAVAAPRAPPVPSSASVARQATVRDAINIHKINLIGVYGSSSQRRALIRLASGKYVKVEVGDRVDGGRVAAIGDGELRYIKRGRNITLKMPKG